MSYTALIVRSDITNIRDISANISNVRIDPYIREAQELDLKNFIGDDLYAELMTEALTSFSANNQTLLDDYLKRPLAFFSYARFLEAQPANVTRYGVVRKENDYSENLSVSDVQKLADMTRKAGNAYFDEARKYLNDNAVDYPLWGIVGVSGSGNWGINIGQIG